MSLADSARRPTAILAEDEPLLADELADLLGKLWPQLQIVARAEDGVATTCSSRSTPRG